MPIVLFSITKWKLHFDAIQSWLRHLSIVAHASVVHTEGAQADVSRSMKLAAHAGLLHTDFMHLAGSLLPWAVLACILELNYGSVRVITLWLVSLLGGAFTSAVLDPSCQVVRG